MTLKEFYAHVGGSYDEALSRLMADRLMLKYLFKFEASAGYEAMMAAVAGENWEETFRHAHNLKGLCLNLALGDLGKSGSALCDAVRSGKPEGDIPALAAAVTADYEKVLAGIAALRETYPEASSQPG